LNQWIHKNTHEGIEYWFVDFFTNAKSISLQFLGRFWKLRGSCLKLWEALGNFGKLGENSWSLGSFGKLIESFRSFGKLVEAWWNTLGIFVKLWQTWESLGNLREVWRSFAKLFFLFLFSSLHEYFYEFMVNWTSIYTFCKKEPLWISETFNVSTLNSLNCAISSWESFYEPLILKLFLHYLFNEFIDSMDLKWCIRHRLTHPVRIKETFCVSEKCNIENSHSLKLCLTLPGRVSTNPFF
jgi:hypothetical protein